MYYLQYVNLLIQLQFCKQILSTKMKFFVRTSLILLLVILCLNIQPIFSQTLYSSKGLHVIATGVDKVFGNRFGTHYVYNSKNAYFFWGNNDNCQCGLDTSLKQNNISRPQEINFDGKLPPVDTISLSAQSTIVLIQGSKRIAGWGLNTSGQLGDRSSIRRCSMSFIYEGTILEKLAVHMVASGQRHALAYSTSTNKIYAWGFGQFGNLGNGEFRDTPYPSEVKLDLNQPEIKLNLLGLQVKVDLPRSDKVVQLECSSQASYILLSSGDLYVTGSNHYFELGLPSSFKELMISQPEKIQLLSGRVSRIWVGSFHVIAMDFDGNYYCWGRNLYGECGVFPRDDSMAIREPTQLDLRGIDGEIVDMWLGYTHTIFYTDRDIVYCAGSNLFGECSFNGDRTQVFTNNPDSATTFKPVDYLNEFIAREGSKIQQLSGGPMESFILLS